jgi:hypothetical protein
MTDIASRITALIPEIRPQDFIDLIRLEDDGSGPRIARWNVPHPQPTMEQLAAVDMSASSNASDIDTLAAKLLEIFTTMTPSQRGRVYPARAGMKMALEEGDIEAARAVIESIDALDEDEQAIKDSMLALFP